MNKITFLSAFDAFNESTKPLHNLLNHLLYEQTGCLVIVSRNTVDIKARIQGNIAQSYSEACPYFNQLGFTASELILTIMYCHWMLLATLVQLYYCFMVLVVDLIASW